MGRAVLSLALPAAPILLGALLWRATAPCRARLAAKKGRVPGPFRERAMLLLFLYLSVLLALTLTPRGFWRDVLSGGRPELPPPFQGGVNLIPLRQSWALLQHYVRNGLWGAFWINFPGNILMFAPVGFFAGLLLDKPRWWKSFLLTGALSVFIELEQLAVSRGTDVDDLILNLLGGLLGHGLCLLFRKFAPGVAQGCRKL